MTESRLVKNYRIGRYLYQKNIPLLPKIFKKINRILYGCELPYTCELSHNVLFVHGGLGVVIHGNAKVGKGSKIYQNVTIGGRNGRGAPIIGENVLIGAGACVLGDINVGDNSQIGANAVVIEDVFENSVVGGIPAKVIKKINTF